MHGDSELVVLVKFLHAEDSDDILEFLVLLEKLLSASCDVVVILTDYLRFEDT